MEQLIKVEIKDGVQVIDSRLVAKGLNIKPQNLMETIRKYQDKLEKLGLLTFETEAVKQEGARGTKYATFCYLNELQCNFVVTLSRNTEAVVDFKLGLVVAFDQAKKEIKILEEVIQESTDFLEKKRLYYQKKGYSDEWIEKRLKSVEVRNELESIWRKNGILESRHFAILTNIISQNTFGLSITDHKKLKGLKSHNLRDHMTRTELIFMMLGEEATIEFVEQDQPKNLDEHKKTAEKGGQLAGTHLALYEKETGKKVVSSLNFLPENRAKYLKKETN
jgi:phage regulator Rha-like protein